MRSAQNDFKLIEGLLAELPPAAEMPLGTGYYATDTDALFILEIDPVTQVRVWGALGGGGGGPFVQTDGTTPLTANWDVGGFQLKNLADPTAAQDAATKAYVDRTSGGTSQSQSTNFTADPLVSTYVADRLGHPSAHHHHG